MIGQVWVRPWHVSAPSLPGCQDRSFVQSGRRRLEDAAVAMSLMVCKIARLRVSLANPHHAK